MVEAEGMSIAFFVSPHGFGHAARACAVMGAIERLRPGVRFELFTTVPAWFFAESLSAGFGYHEVVTDVGMAQLSSLEEDPAGTVRKLDRFFPFDDETLEQLAAELGRLGCRAVICDISPLGLAVAERAHLPSVLVESFTWDWIYEGYSDECPALSALGRKLGPVFDSAGLRVQTAPLCREAAGAERVAPIARSPRTDPATTRRRLGVADGVPIVLLTMGGIPWEFSFLEDASAAAGAWLVIPGGSEAPEVRDGMTLLPHRSDFYHPDLIAAADAVVGKLGYSTVAEAYHAGRPFAFVERPRFRESAVLAWWVREHMEGFALPAGELESGAFAHRIPELLALPCRPRPEANGAEEAATLILSLLEDCG